MLLKFYARDRLLVSKPGPRAVGQPARYIGRIFVAPSGASPATYAASEQPYEVDSESDEGRRCVEVTRRDASLFPADKDTAAFCGVALPDVSFKEGVWSLKPVKPAKEPQVNG